jgi:hypothetical protein
LSKKVLGILALVLTAVVILACGEAATPATVVNGTVTAAPTPKPFEVGEHVKVGFWIVTINSVQTNTGDGEFNVPKGVYLVIDASFQNTDSQSHTISSLIQFTLSDSTGQKYDPAIVTLAGIHEPDGDVQPGKTTRGQTVYDVPKNLKAFEFTFEDPFSGSAATWNLTVK